MDKMRHPLLQELQQELEQHPVNSNIYFQKFLNQSLSPQQLRMFLKQYHYFCKHFVKLLEGLLYRTPVDQINMRIELAKTLYSELGNGKPGQAHITLLTNFSRALGIKDEELARTEPLPSVITYLETLDRLFMESDFLRALGAELAVEVTAASEFKYFYPGLSGYDMFKDQDLEFFRLHLEEEAQHESWLLDAVEATAESHEDYERVALGARSAADAWHSFWLGMDQATFLFTQHELATSWGNTSTKTNTSS